jgi:hypothetical protein
MVTTVDKQIARQQLGQHWFIPVNIVVYIQGLYTVYNSAGVQSTFAMLGLARTRGVGSLPIVIK